MTVDRRLKHRQLYRHWNVFAEHPAGRAAVTACTPVAEAAFTWYHDIIREHLSFDGTEIPDLWRGAGLRGHGCTENKLVTSGCRSIPTPGSSILRQQCGRRLARTTAGSRPHASTPGGDQMPSIRKRTLRGKVAVIGIGMSPVGRCRRRARYGSPPTPRRRRWPMPASGKAKSDGVLSSHAFASPFHRFSVAFSEVFGIQLTFYEHASGVRRDGGDDVQYWRRCHCMAASPRSYSWLAATAYRPA